LSSRRACKRLELRHIRTKSYTPKTNGKAERFIQTSLREWAYAYAYQNSRQRRDRLLYCPHSYNWHRPHAGIDDKTPISRLAPTEKNVLGLHSRWLHCTLSALESRLSAQRPAVVHEIKHDGFRVIARKERQSSSPL
jgi:putative transposase